MKFGHFCLPTYFPDLDGTPGQLMRRWLDLLTESEALGFDSLFALGIILARSMRSIPSARAMAERNASSSAASL